jgi:hypothetical protein
MIKLFEIVVVVRRSSRSPVNYIDGSDRVVGRRSPADRTSS